VEGSHILGLFAVQYSRTERMHITANVINLWFSVLKRTPYSAIALLLVTEDTDREGPMHKITHNNSWKVRV
jgi:hypothetical protein